MSAEPAPTLPLWRRLRRRFYHRFLVVILWGAQRVPLSFGRLMGKMLARTGARLRRRDRQRALSNLALAFPEMDTVSLQKVFDDSVGFLGENFHDTMVTPDLMRRQGMVRENHSTGEAGLIETIGQLTRTGRGVLILGGHLGCWELLGAWLANRLDEAGMGPLGVVTGTIHNPQVDLLVQERRRKLGMRVLPRTAGVAPLIRHLREGRAVAVLLDQNTRVENLMIPFFGREAPTPAGFARIALRYGVPVLPVAIARVGKGHQISWGKPWLPDESGQDDPDSLVELLTWCNGTLEEFIRRNPEQWVWFHHRWPKDKEQPST